MNRAFLPLFKSLSIAVLALSSFASVAYANAEVQSAKADPAKGEALFVNGDAARGIIACISCHGAAGNSTISVNPKLSAQHDAYIVKQLSNFAGPDRVNPIMSTFAKALTPEDMKNLGAYLSMQKSTPGAAKNAQIVELGKQIYRGGIAEKNVPACAGCHSPNGAGIPAQFPRIAGQHQDYTLAQLTNFRTGARKNSAQMLSIAKKMSDDEMKAVADYIAGLK
ncbi:MULTISPECIES: c-type cytochrome [unclassified Undibacterium]|uniref:c-type cytochrome n=1 Tax=unclassified Undibacterium TaxID=2630295 RepID=UPI002AC95811|nr:MULTISPECIES: c-type cytochrome [unclassified Undibacterium]MEB0137524.1 c-type cytochrome [Undibacterium sp. CCC2.1]MEB0170811.1 c-type cytochrome [Undibacterium sp. CCC1.1]MEB0174763.1 c-type cytochrome [Undibacterium sp. CCC3.4]MEB0214099.1 c-type cytochrome [Undibacterium sp. 5I2]WPX44415.1 c-type cytochrome [Undibacterium sp. CCC3.4]